jgi:cytohesin
MDERVFALFHVTYHAEKKNIETLVYNRVDINELYWGRHILDHPIVDKYGLPYLDFLLNCGVCPNIQDGNGQHSLYIACRQGYLDTVNFLLSKGAKPNLQDKRGNTALHASVYLGGEEKGEYTIDDLTPEEIHDNIDIMKLLVKNGANINIKNNMGGTPLFDVVAGNNYEATAILLELGADQTIPNNEGKLPLDVASQDNIRELLLQYQYPTIKRAQ